MKEENQNKQPKKNFNEYQNLMKQKFDWEDKKVKVFNQIYKLKNENLQCCQQLRLVEDQLRNWFGRERIEVEKEE